MADSIDEPRSAAPASGAAALEHLTGPSRGRVSWLGASAVDVMLTDGQYLRVADSGPGEPPPDLIARLHRTGDGYELEVPDGQAVWVNGVRVNARRLEKSDMIEFGETGPLSRYCLFTEDRPIRKTVGEIVSDSFAYLRVSRLPMGKRMVRGVCALTRRLARETTILFRAAVIIAILALAAFAYYQVRVNALLQQRIESGAARLDSFAGAISRAREQALRPADLEALRQEFGGRLASTAERLAALEKRSRAAARVIADSISSVVFLQGAYGLRERSSKRMLRHVVDEDGRPMMSPAGQPLLSLEGDGPVAERQFTGTAFAVGDGKALITNRHVALPWESDASAEELLVQDLEPVMIKFIAYQPGRAKAVPVDLARASDSADLAVLRCGADAAAIPGLKLADAVPARGDEVIVMGYPTGLHSMLAQSGEAFIRKLQETKDIEFWSVAARLAEDGHIAPLSSRGIVGQATAATIVYDAETTHGGSGGPVLDMNGAVVAVNAAILPEFGGSNLGVPAAKVRALMKEAGLR